MTFCRCQRPSGIITSTTRATWHHGVAVLYRGRSCLNHRIRRCPEYRRHPARLSVNYVSPTGLNKCVPQKCVTWRSIYIGRTNRRNRKDEPNPWAPLKWHIAFCQQSHGGPEYPDPTYRTAERRWRRLSGLRRAQRTGLMRLVNVSGFIAFFPWAPKRTSTNVELSVYTS